MTSCNTYEMEHGPSDNRETSDVVLKIEGLSKKFAYSSKNVRRYGLRRLVRELVGGGGQSSHLNPGEFWALKDIELELRRGETLGVIGLNGAGKSTLLKIINGVYLPDSGRVAVKGSVGGLIEIGAGFQPGLSGLGNIRLVGAILGMSGKEIDESLEDIISFADLGKFINSPVQSYSSGMKVRLGFAIHIFQKPDLLLADEVLAVGDFDFRQKCLAMINRMKSDLAMILVSHSMPTIVRACDRVVVLEDAKIAYDGDPNGAVTFFTNTQAKRNIKSVTATGHRDSKAVPQASAKAPSEEAGKEDADLFVSFPSGKKIAKGVFGSEYRDETKISNVNYVLQFNGEPNQRVVEFEAQVRLDLSFQLLAATNRLNIGVAILSLEGVMVTGFYADVTEMEIPVSSSGMVAGTLVIPKFALNPGEYGGSLAIFDGTEYYYRKILEGISIVRSKPGHGRVSLYHGAYTDTYHWEFPSNGTPGRDDASVEITGLGLQ
jgi:lipopolysaccharide transport system ATP-binding protein